MSERIVGYVDIVFRPEKKISKNGKPYLVKKIKLLTNDGPVWIHVTAVNLFDPIDRKFKPGTPAVVFPSMKLDNTAFIGKFGRIIPASEDDAKTLRPYEELKKMSNNYKFSTIEEIINGDYGFYNVYAEVYRISNVVPIEKGDKKYTKIRIGIEDYTGNLFASTFHAVELLKVAGMTENDVWQIYYDEMNDIKTNNEKEIKEKRKDIQKKIAENITGVAGRTFVITIKKTKFQRSDGKVVDDYLITRIEDPSPDAISALAKGVIA